MLLNLGVVSRKTPRLARGLSSAPFRILFCGSDSFSQDTLAALLEAEGGWLLH